jgi:hypothetical protein
LTSHRYRHFEKTEVLYGIDKNVKAILEFINKSKYRYDVYADSKGPFFVIKIEALKNAYIEFVRKGGHIRFITEIIKENLNYCKEMMKFVELRHIEGIKGIVRINEKEYQSNLAVQESKLASVLLSSTFKKVVELQQHAFDNLWKTAIHAEQQIKEIEIEVGADDSRSKESHKTIQLWTNQDQNQYAIRLEGKSDLLATTNQNAQYIDLVEESDYLEELEYDWDYTLKHCINNIIDNQTLAYSSGRTLETKIIIDKKRVEKRQGGSKRSRLKCNFCELEFHNNKSRREHEQTWHATASAPVKL